MKKLLLLLAFFSLTTLTLDAQTHKNELGIRLGYYGNLGVSFKHWLGESSAIEAIAFGRFYTFYNYIEINGLYEKHQPITEVDNLLWYWGIGGFIGLSNYDDGYFGATDTSISVGITGALGLTYQFEDVPISVALDWMPRIAISRGGFYGGIFGARGGGVAVRYAF